MACVSRGAVFTDRKSWIQETIVLKNLSVVWNKVKSHSGVYGNEHANLLANAATSSVVVLPVGTSCHFLSIEKKPVSGNAHHFIKHLFDAVSFVSWEAKYVNYAVENTMHNIINVQYIFSV
ncbi:hypothetical protein G9A89_002571 [Geosiphon pyriformis]|nr:hypothetical protein G9A89_002571 [Geosiphon pyriformis]